MKHLIICFILVISIQGLQSCGSYKYLPLKGSYSTGHTATTSKTKDEVWDKLIDIVAETGMKIKTIDKSSGLLISEDYSFKGSITREDLDGKVANPDAWVICSSHYYKGSGYTWPNQVVGNLNVRVKETTGDTQISIHIVNLVGTLEGVPAPSVKYEVASTGVFEKKLAAKLM